MSDHQTDVSRSAWHAHEGIVESRTRSCPSNSKGRSAAPSDVLAVRICVHVWHAGAVRGSVHGACDRAPLIFPLRESEKCLNFSLAEAYFDPLVLHNPAPSGPRDFTAVLASLSSFERYQRSRLFPQNQKWLRRPTCEKNEGYLGEKPKTTEAAAQ